MPLEPSHLRLVLLILLLCGQTLVMAHELGHELRAADDYCAECLTQSVFADTLAPDSQYVPALKTVALALAPLTSSCCKNRLPTNAARAPPFSFR